MARVVVVFTSYINDMASVSSSYAQKILNWHSTYNKFKSLRHIISHSAELEIKIFISINQFFYAYLTAYQFAIMR